MNNDKFICHVYSLPFTFTRLKYITNNFPNIVFNTVTHLYAYDTMAFEHEFFMRISQAFPVLKCFSVKNERMQPSSERMWWNERIKPLIERMPSWYDYKLKSDENLSDPIIEYPHLTLLDLMHAHCDYVTQFLSKTKTHLPRLTELKVKYDELVTVTEYFRRDDMRPNCSKVKRLVVEDSIDFSKDVYQYFPSL
jgi:hypothetical protein